MSELEILAPEDQELVAIHAFSIAALGFNRWIYSDGAHEDVSMSFYALQQGGEHPRVDGTEWRRNLAAMRIMQTLADSINDAQPVLILPEIAEAEDLYDEADTVIDRVGLSRMPEHSATLLYPVVQCFVKDTPPETKVDEVLAQVKANRGVVSQEETSLSEIMKAIKNTPEEESLQGFQVLSDGTLVEIHKIPKGLSKIVEVPFYEQHISSSVRAENYLRTFLEDALWVSNQF